MTACGACGGCRRALAAAEAKRARRAARPYDRRRQPPRRNPGARRPR